MEHTSFLTLVSKCRSDRPFGQHPPVHHWASILWLGGCWMCRDPEALFAFNYAKVLAAGLRDPCGVALLVLAGA